MRKAARAIVIENNKLLVMHRNKHGSQYYTLVGGKIDDDESEEEGLVREVREETGLQILKARLVFIEEHPEPYNEQYIYLCDIGNFDGIKIQDDSEEALMNKISINTHQPIWVEISAFPQLPFRTGQLQTAILDGIKKGFPNQPINI